MATLAYQVIDELVLFVSGQATLSDPDWQQYTRVLGERIEQVRGTGQTLKFLVFSDEGAPNPKQRAVLVEMLRGIPARTAVLSSSIVARNLITVFGWLNFSIKGFAPNRLSAAIAYLELSGEVSVGIVERAISLARRVGGVRSLDMCVAAEDGARK